MLQKYPFDKDRKRRISMEKNFLNYQYNNKKTNDLLYCLLYYLATYNTKEKHFYLTMKEYKKHKNEIKELCEIGTDRTLNRQMQVLFDSGLIQKGKTTINNSEVECILFEYEVKEKYILVSCEMLFYLISTRNKNAVRVYCWLLDKYNWKSKEQSIYEFSIKEIMHALGYETAKDTNTLVSKSIKNILDSFKREGVIDYKETVYTTIDKNGNTINIPKKELLYVAVSLQDLKKRTF